MGPYRIAADFIREDVRELRKFVVVLSWGIGTETAANKYTILAKDGAEALDKALSRANVGRVSRSEINKEENKGKKQTIQQDHLWLSYVLSIEDFYIDDNDRKKLDKLNAKVGESEEEGKKE